MNYNQILQYIVTWIKENHNNEITGDILQDVLVQIVQYVKEGSDNVDVDIQELQNQIDAISLSQEIEVFEGNEDPNVVPPPDTYSAPDFYVKTDTNDVFVYTGSSWFKITQAGGGGSTGIYQGASPTTRTVGGLNAGTEIAGKTYDEIFEAMLAEYVAPSISSFAINQTSPIEVGTVISGNKNFTFSFSQSGNVKQNSVKIIDGITNTVLAENLPKTSPQSVDIGTVVKLEEDSHLWRIEAESTKGATIQRNSSPVTWLFRWFFGGSDTDITTSTQARALEDSVLSTGGSKQFVAGTEHTDFYFLINDEAQISSVTDLTALNADITSAYVLQGTMTVDDVGGNPHTYKKYKLSLASAYASPHTHEFIITYP